MEHKQMCFPAIRVSETDMGICASSCSPSTRMEYWAVLAGMTLEGWMGGWMKSKCGKRGIQERCLTKMSLPMFTSSSVSASPMHSNWNSCSDWENFCTAAERSVGKNIKTVWTPQHSKHKLGMKDNV